LQDVDGGVDVSVLDIFTIVTNMSPGGQRLLHFFTTVRAILTGVMRGNCNSYLLILQAKIF
jgi:hypothetical protein